MRIGGWTAGPLRSWVLGAAAVATLTLAAGGAQASGGVLDPSFASGGKVLTDLGVKSYDGASAVVVQADGKIVVAGSSKAKGKGVDFALVRYTTSGKLDSSFGTGGKVLTDFGKVDRLAAVALQADGKIVAAGDTGEILSETFIEGRFAVARYTSSGKLDPTFGRGGKAVTDLGGGSSAEAADMELQQDGTIVVVGTRSYAVGGRSYDDVAVVRFTKSGKLDTTFGSAGIVQTDMAQKGADEPSAVAVQTDGKIVVVGRTAHNGSAAEAPRADFGIVRYLSGGRLDPSFGIGGKVITDLQAGSDDWPHAVAIAADGKIVVAGDTATKGNGGTVNLDSNFAVVRYTTSGRLDAGFGTGGKVVTDFGHKTTDGASDIALQPGGRIIAAGGTYANDADFALVRYTPGGKLDPSFGRGGKVTTEFGPATSESIAAVALQADGKIVAAGSSNEDFAIARYTK
jgi:uncharacterized delta-60 repeat protein